MTLNVRAQLTATFRLVHTLRGTCPACGNRIVLVDRADASRGILGAEPVYNGADPQIPNAWLRCENCLNGLELDATHVARVIARR